MVSITTKVASLSPTRCGQKSILSGIAASPSVKHVINLLGLQENSPSAVPTAPTAPGASDVPTLEQEWMMLLGNTAAPNSATTDSPSSTTDCRKPQYVANLQYPLRVIGTAFTATCIFWGWVFIYFAQTTTKFLSYPVTDSQQRAVACARILNGVSYYTTTIMNPLWKVTVLKPMVLPPSPPAQPTEDEQDTTVNSTSTIKSWLKKPLNASTKKPCIYVINHLSNADPWICSSAGIPSDTVWICKGALFKVPFGGWAIANSGHLKVEFTSEKNGWGTKKGAVKKMMDQARECIRSGRSVGVYPEGARNLNPNGPIAEFKLGFFNLAVEMGIDIVPVALSGTDKMWPVNEALFDKSDAFVSFGEPIAAVGETAESLRDKAHQAISEMRDQHPDRATFLNGQKTTMAVQSAHQEATIPVPI